MSGKRSDKWEGGFKARILGTGSYLPETRLSDEEIVRRWNLGDDEGLEELTRFLGRISDRREAREESCMEMLRKAALSVLEDASVSARDLDAIVVSAESPDDPPEPDMACYVHGKIGADEDRCFAYDTGMCCVGWIKGIYDALLYIDRGAENVLVLAGFRAGNTKCLDPKQRLVFGDGAGGVLIGRSDHENFERIGLFTSGKHYDKITLTPERGFDMANVFAFRRILGEKIKKLESFLEGVDRESIDKVLIHKPSNPVYALSLRLLGFPEEKILQSYDRYGSTGPVELPIALHEAVKRGAGEEGRVQRGDELLCFTYGAGVVGGAALLKF